MWCHHEEKTRWPQTQNDHKAGRDVHKQHRGVSPARGARLSLKGTISTAVSHLATHSLRQPGAWALHLCPLLLKLRHTAWKHPDAWLAVLFSGAPHARTHFFLRLPEFAVRAYRRLYGSPSPCAPRLAGAHSSTDRAAPTMTRVEDGREMNALPENRHIWGGPVNAARSTGKESFFLPLLLLQGAELFLPCCFGVNRRRSREKKAVLHAAYRAHEVWDIFFHPVQQRPRNAARFCLKEEVCVWREGEEFLPSSLTLFSIICFFFVCVFVFRARCFERQGRLRAAGVVWGWRWWCSVERRWRRRRRAVCSTAQTSGGPSLRLNHNNTADSPRRAGREGSGDLGGWKEKKKNLDTYNGVKMTMSVPERKSGSEGKEEESEDESEILEESPCGRWQKRKEQVGLCVCVRARACVCSCNCHQPALWSGNKSMELQSLNQAGHVPPSSVMQFSRARPESIKCPIPPLTRRTDVSVDLLSLCQWDRNRLFHPRRLFSSFLSRRITVRDLDIEPEVLRGSDSLKIQGGCKSQRDNVQCKFST